MWRVAAAQQLPLAFAGGGAGEASGVEAAAQNAIGLAREAAAATPTLQPVGDGAGAQAQLDRIVTGWRLRRVAPALIIRTNAQTEAAILAAKRLDHASLAQCAELGQAMAEGLAGGIF